MKQSVASRVVPQVQHEESVDPPLTVYVPPGTNNPVRYRDNARQLQNAREDIL